MKAFLVSLFSLFGSLFADVEIQKWDVSKTIVVNDVYVNWVNASVTDDEIEVSIVLENYTNDVKSLMVSFEEGANYKDQKISIKDNTKITKTFTYKRNHTPVYFIVWKNKEVFRHLVVK